MRALRAPSSAVRLVVAASFLVAGGSAQVHAQQATPSSSAPVVIASEVLGRARPVATENPELALGRVTIMPGAAIPAHHHPGTQIGVIVQGTLTYAVFNGSVAWYRASDSSSEPRTILAGETVQVAVGDTLIETPYAVHQGRNEGTVPIVIYVSTLFPEGEPRSILDNATPTP